MKISLFTGGALQPVQHTSEGNSNSIHNGPQSSQNTGDKVRFSKSSSVKQSSGEDTQHSEGDTSIRLGECAYADALWLFTTM